MLQCGQSIRLTKADFEQLALLTQETPDPTVVKTVEQLNAFLDRHIARFPGQAGEMRLMRHLLELEKVKQPVSA